MKKKSLFKLAVMVLTIAVLLPSAFSATEMISSAVSSLDAGDDLTYVIDGTYIKDIPEGVTVSELIAEFGSGSVTKSSGYVSADAARVGTGYQFTTGNKTYTLIVNGDLNGDTYVTTKDVIRAKKMVKTGGNSTYASALDFNDDGVSDESDITDMADFVLHNKPKYAVGQLPSAELGDDFYATIELSYTEKVVGASVDHNVLTMDKTNSPNKVWRFTRNDDGSYYIKNVGMGTVLDVAYSSSDYGTNVALYKNIGAENQKWHVVEREGGYVFSTLCAEDRVLDISESSVNAGANVQIYGVNYSASQIFNINKIKNVPTDEAGYLTYFSALDYPAEFYANLNFGTRNISVADNGNACLLAQGQFWKFEHQADGTYKITSAYSGNVLDVANGAMADFSNVQTNPDNNSSTQRWYIYIKDGKVVLRSAANQNFVLDVHGGLDIDNGNIQIYSFNSTDAQWFTFVDVVKELPQYRVTCPYNSVLYGRYTSLAEAKANVVGYLGQVVYDARGNLVYNPNPSLNAAKILHHGKLNADYMRVNGYIYGDASVNPALNKTEKVVSCDRFVGWTLYDAGFNRNGQPATKGYTLYTTNSLEQLLISLGFTKITNQASVMGGDIVFVGTSTNLAVPANYKNYPCHVFICAGSHASGNHYRYDAGSNTRIKSVQPSLEPLSYSNMAFRFAYRAP